jgi:SOS-response transcriptional repressor LexA
MKENNLAKVSLTPSEKKIYDLIVYFVNRKGFAPHIEEIANLTNFAISTIYAYFRRLHKKKFINLDSDFNILAFPEGSNIYLEERNIPYTRSVILTKRQKEVYDFIKSFIQTNNRSPLIREIMSGITITC